jgi:predicted dehydrogenase
MTRVKEPKKVRYAVVGAGNIAQVAVLPAFAHAKDNSELVAIVSGDAEKRRALRERYDLEFDGDYAELESIIERAQVDAVYLATPNAQHKELILRAAQAGAHVLCEKPLATSVAECEEVIEACEQARVKLMVAYRLHFEEANLKAIEICKSGKLGELRLFDSFFSHVVRPGDIREQAQAGGGAMFDLGVYCINAARNLFRAEPIEVFATLQEKNGVDDTTTAILKFPGDRLALFTVSNSTAGVSSYRIAGSEGDLRVEPAYEYAGKLEHHLTVDGKTKSESFGKRDQFAPELEHFSRCILEDRTPEPDGQEGLHDVRVIEAVLKSAKTRQPVQLEPLVDRRRPTLAQESRKPPVKEPRTVNAPSPSVK